MTQLSSETLVRTAARPIEPIFLERWSPRAMSGDAVTQIELETLFEAARWAPSTYNEQEWRFLFAHREDPDFDQFFDLLVEANQAWCDRAGALIVVLSHKVFAKNQKPNPVHSLDTGMSVQNLLLQAAAMNLVAHAMAGFDRDQTRQQLQIPEDYGIECMIAIGRPGQRDQLPAELRDREHPSDRKPIEEFAFAGKFPG